jgi:NADH-quinone oxidoreductase subunit G
VPSIAVPVDAVSAEAQRIAQSLVSGERAAVLLGNMAQHHAHSSDLHRLGLALAQICGARFGFLGEAANSVGGYIAGALPFGALPGLNAGQMLAQPLRAYLLLNAEADLDTHNPRRALAAMRGADFVVALSAFRHRAIDYADALLPVAPFTETAGSFVNSEGRLQSFNGVVRPLGEARPAWKVLRVIGNLMGVAGFDFDSAEEVRADVLRGVELPERLSNAVAESDQIGPPDRVAAGIQRIADVPIYFADPLVRRAGPLQQTRDAATPVASMPGSLMERLGLKDGEKVRVTQDGGEAVLDVARDDRVPPECVRVPAAHPLTAGLGAMSGDVQLVRVPAETGVTA